MHISEIYFYNLFSLLRWMFIHFKLPVVMKIFMYIARFIVNFFPHSNGSTIHLFIHLDFQQVS